MARSIENLNDLYMDELRNFRSGDVAGSVTTIIDPLAECLANRFAHPILELPASKLVRPPRAVRPAVVCPECGQPREQWPTDGVVCDGSSYCCAGCAQRTGCYCWCFEADPEEVEARCESAEAET